MDTMLMGLPPSFSSPLPSPNALSWHLHPLPLHLHPIPCHAPCAMHHAPCTMHHVVPMLLHHAPCALHLAPCTMRLTAPRPFMCPYCLCTLPFVPFLLVHCYLYFTYIPTPTCTMFIYISCSPPSSLSCPPELLMMQARRTVSQSYLGCRAHPGPLHPGLQMQPFHIASC